MTVLALPLAPSVAARVDVRATARQRLFALLSRAPLTAGYLGLLAATSILQMIVPAATRQALLAGSSTDVLHLFSVPARVLLASALWLPDLDWFQTVALFTLVLAPVEARLGTRRLLLIFLTGHVLATLVTELPVAAAIATGHLPATSRARLDVGVSYGFWTVYAVRVWQAQHRGIRVLFVLGAVVQVLIPLLRDREVTTWGHLASLATGAVIVISWRAPRTRATDGAVVRCSGDHHALLAGAVPGAPVAVCRPGYAAGGGRRRSRQGAGPCRPARAGPWRPPAGDAALTSVRADPGSRVHRLRRPAPQRPGADRR